MLWSQAPYEPDILGAYMNMSVSVIITTKNSERTIERCMSYLKADTTNIAETILVDNSSSDRTVEIARKLGAKTYTYGPERSAQRNFGIRLASAPYVFIMNSDILVTPSLIRECLELCSSGFDAVSIGWISQGEGYWTQCRALESLFYHYDSSILCPLFFKKSVILKVKGFDENLAFAGEDIDLLLRLINQGYRVAVARNTLIHLEPRYSISNIVQRDVRAIDGVRKYLRKRRGYRYKFGPTKFVRAYWKNRSVVRTRAKHLPGLALLKILDFMTVLIALVTDS